MRAAPIPSTVSSLGWWLSCERLGQEEFFFFFLSFFFSLSFFFRCEAEGYGSREHIHKSGFILSEARLCFFLWKKGTAKKDGKNTGLLLMCLCVVSSKSFLSLEIEHVVFILSRWESSLIWRGWVATWKGTEFLRRLFMLRIMNYNLALFLIPKLVTIYC